MISVAIDTCWMSMCRTWTIPKAMASVSGIEAAISSAARQSQKPTRATTTTSAMASHRLAMSRLTRSFTCLGWSEVRSTIRSGGSCGRTSASALSTALPKSPICSPERICTASVTARLRCHLPLSSCRVR